MASKTDNRKSRFRAALALSRMTAAEWAQANGVHPGHLSAVLAGKRESISLTEKIEAFTDKRLGAAA